MHAQTAVPSPHSNGSVATEAIQLSGVDILLSIIFLFMLTVFFTSLVKWIVLLSKGARLFGDSALVPARPRARPYWNPALLVFFVGVLIVASQLLTGLAIHSGWIAKPVRGSEPIVVNDVVVSDTMVPQTVDPLDPFNAVEDVKAARDSLPSPAAPPISVPHLVISSASMLIATLVTILLAQMLRPRISPSLSEDDQAIPRERPRMGLFPQPGDISLGFWAAWLILPPMMLLMGLVSILQKYSHPVLDALQPSGPDSAPNFAVFAALFFTTAIITPFVEEFLFRGCLQGGLQRLADIGIGSGGHSGGESLSAASADTYGERIEDATTADISGEVIEDVNTAVLVDPYASPREVHPLAAQPLDSRSTQEIERDRDTRADWTPTAVWPIVATSFIFAVMHWGQGLAPIPLFFLSLGLGYLYRQTGSLVPSIVVHFTLNGFTMCMTLLQILH